MVQRAGLILILATIGLSTAILQLTGCSPATAKQQTSPASPTLIPTSNKTPELDTRPVVACFGDSLTAGYGTDPGQSYPDYLQKLLDAEGFHYHVVNAGVSGNTTKDGLERIPHVLARHPQIVVLEFGGNDGLRGLPLEQTKANLSTMIGQLQQSGAQVALAGITLPPSYGPDYIGKFNAMYPALARQYHLPLLAFLLKGVYGTVGDMQDDETHATAQGNQRVARNVEALIHPLLKH